MQFVYKKRTASEDICRKIFQFLAFFLVLYFSFWTNTAYMSGLHDQTDVMNHVSVRFGRPRIKTN